MPCTVDQGFEYAEQGRKLAEQKWINQEMEEALCISNTLLLKVLNTNKIILSSSEEDIIEKIKREHLAHRREEIELFRDVIKQKLDEQNDSVKSCISEKATLESRGFKAGADYYERLEWLQLEACRIWQQLDHLERVLDWIKLGDKTIIQEVLTNRNIHVTWK